MKRILTLTTLTLRSMLREKVVLCMLALLAIVLFLLPIGLEGDGTLEGDVRMHIRYTLGFATVLIAGMTLWVSCASIATDLANRRLHMVLTKPVSRWQIWWGKWLAATLLISLLMGLTAGVTLWRVHQRLGEARLPPAEREHILETLITARDPVEVQIEEEELRAAARTEIRQRLDSGWVPPPQLSEEELLRQTIVYLRTLRFAVRAGEPSSWTFLLDRPVQAGERLQLGLRYDGTSMGMTLIKGEWILGTPEQPDRKRISVSGAPSGREVYLFNLDGAFDGATTITASFSLEGEAGRMLFFKPETGVRIYRPGGSFAPNLIRATLLLTGLLSLLAALGVGCGGVFSLPVACYATSVFLILQAFSGVVTEVIAEESTALARETPAGIENVIRQARLLVFRGVERALSPLDLGHPLERLSQGERISSGEVFRTLTFRFIPLLLVTAGFWGWLFHRREVGGAT